MTLPESIAMQRSGNRDSFVEETVKFLSDVPHEAKTSGSKPILQVLTRPVMVTVVFLLMDTFQIGYYLAVVSNTQGVIEDFLNATIFEREGSHPSGDKITNLWAIIVAIFFIGGGVGCVCNSWILDNLSRKRAHILNMVVGFVSFGFLFSARYLKFWELLLVGRLLVGFQCGIYSGLCVACLTEISPKETRGAMTTANNVGIYFGMLVSQVIGFPDIFGTDELWPFAYGFGIIPLLVQLLLVFFSVESPRYLLLIRQDEEAARKALQTLRQSQAVDEEIEEMKEEMKATTKPVTFVELLRYGPYRRTTLLASISMFTVQLCGLGVVLFYSNTMFQEGASLSPANAAYLTSCIGLISIVMTFVTIPLSEKAGRRWLNLIGNSCLVVDMSLITISLALKDTVEGLKLACIVLLLMYIAFYVIGSGSVPWMLVGDLFTQKTRPVGSSIAIVFIWLGGFIVGYIFPPMQRAFTDYVFIPFIVYLSLAVVYFYFYQPETKGKTSQDIMAMFERPGDSPRLKETYSDV